jgi:septum formation protein
MDQLPIILASASPRREELLRQMGLKFRVLPSGFDESDVMDLLPEEHVTKSAMGKADDVAERVSHGIIIGADTVVVVDDQILGKPGDAADARRMLKMLSSREHFVYTGLSVVRKDISKRLMRLTGYERTLVRFGPLTDEIIDAYVETGEPLDKAGAYGIQERGSVLVQSIDGDYFNVVGLPIYRLSRMLMELGVPLLRK